MGMGNLNTKMTYTLYRGDCLEEMDRIATGSVDAIVARIPTMRYNSTMKTSKLSDEEIKRGYESGSTLRVISRAAGIDHHRIKRILLSQGVDIREGYTLPPFSNEHKEKIGRKSKGRIPYNRGIPASDEMIIKYIAARIEGVVDLSNFDDPEKLKILTQISSKRKQLRTSDENRQAFFDRFYFDEAFRAIYDLWIQSGKCKWRRPTLDHIIPLCRGGGWELGNLQFLTWFENRAKADMTGDEWEAFKRTSNTHSDLFIESILNGS